MFSGAGTFDVFRGHIPGPKPDPSVTYALSVQHLDLHETYADKKCLAVHISTILNMHRMLPCMFKCNVYIKHGVDFI